MNITDLPNEILMTIFENLDESSLHSNILVCKLFKQISEDNLLWKNSLKKRRLEGVTGNFKRENLEFIRKYNSFFKKLYEIPHSTFGDTVSSIDAYAAKKQVDDFIKGKDLSIKFQISLNETTSLEEALYFNEAGALNSDTLERSLIIQLYDIVKLHLEERVRLNKIISFAKNRTSLQILELILKAKIDEIEEIDLTTATRHPETLELLLKFWEKDIPTNLLEIAKIVYAPEASLNLIKEALNKSNVTLPEA